MARTIAKLEVFRPFQDPNASSSAARKSAGAGRWTYRSSIAVRIKALAVFFSSLDHARK